MRTQQQKPQVVRVAIYLRQSYDAALRKTEPGERPEVDRVETEIRRAGRRQVGV